MCDAELTLVDLDIGDPIALGRNDIIIDRNDITFTVKHLSNNHTYNVTVVAENIAGSAISYTSIDINMFAYSTTAAELPGYLDQKSKIIHVQVVTNIMW